MRILITGATGFIGKALSQRLLLDDHELVIMTRDKTGLAKKFPYPCQAHLWGDGGFMPDEALKGVDAVVNLAGESVAAGRWTDEAKKRILDSRVKTTRSVVEALRRRKIRGEGPPTLVNASAIGFYGDRGDEVLDETAAAGAGFLAEVCQRWEGEATTAGNTVSRLVILRLGVVLGRDGGALPRMLLPFSLGMGGRLGNGRQWMGWIHKDDAVEMFCRAATDPAAKGVYNATAPAPVTNGDFTKMLAKTLRRPALAHIPAFALKAALGEMSTVVLASQRAVPAAAESAGFPFKHRELAGALADLCGAVN